MSKKTKGFMSVAAAKRRIAEMYDMTLPTGQLAAAYMIATLAHAAQQRKNGRPYIIHPIKVAQTNTRSMTKEIIGVLHDVLEDSKWTAQDLRDLGFSERVISAVESLTKKPGELYFDFGERCSLNADALDRKIEDLTTNLDESDNNHFLSPEDVTRINKYKLLRAYLVDVKQGKIEPGSSFVDFALNHEYFSKSLTTVFLLQEYSSRAQKLVIGNDNQPSGATPVILPGMTAQP